MREGSQGFTLIELLMVVVVMAVLLVVAVPSFDAMLKRNRIVSASNSMLGAMQLARDEAMLRGKTVSLCRRAQPSVNTACTNTNFGGSGCNCVNTSSPISQDGWEDGWLMYEDNAALGQVDSNDVLIRAFEPLLPQFQLRGNTATLKNYIPFAADGSSSAGSLFLCLSGTETAADSERIRTARRLRITRTGQVNILNGETCNDA